MPFLAKLVIRPGLEPGTQWLKVLYYRADEFKKELLCGGASFLSFAQWLVTPRVVRFRESAAGRDPG